MPRSSEAASIMDGSCCCLAAKMYLYCALRVTTNRPAASRPSRIVAASTRREPGARSAPAIRRTLVISRLAVGPDDLEKARAARVRAVRGLVSERRPVGAEGRMRLGSR